MLHCLGNFQSPTLLNLGRTHWTSPNIPQVCNPSKNALPCSLDNKTATSLPVKECLHRVERWYFVGSSGNCFKPSTRSICLTADKTLYLSFRCVWASFCAHCGNGFLSEGGGRFRNIPRATVPVSLVAVASTAV